MIVERLAYFEHQEDYKVIEINGTSVQPRARQAGRRFVVRRIWFRDEGHLRARNGDGFHLANLVHAARAEDARVRLPGGGKRIPIITSWCRSRHEDLVTAYHGLIFIDDRKHFVHRITLHADGIPPRFPVQDVSLMLDYEYTRIGDASLSACRCNFELRSRDGNVLIKNDVDYDNYRKFTADTRPSVSWQTPWGRTPRCAGPQVRLSNECRRLDRPKYRTASGSACSCT